MSTLYEEEDGGGRGLDNREEDNAARRVFSWPSKLIFEILYRVTGFGSQHFK